MLVSRWLVPAVVAFAVAAATLFPSSALSARAGGATSNASLPGSSSAGSAPAYGSYSWPLRGPVIRPFDPPDTPFGAGHRGIDIAAPLGTPVWAAADGVVAFAGRVAGSLFVSVDHPDGVRTTYSWLGTVEVAPGAPVGRGDVLGTSGPGHAGLDPPHLHFGARVGDVYIDPMLLLERASLVGLVHLAPLEEPI
jgi:murein DD-endopeptidase MepM/ murein hydrolase activator NlpD